MFYIYVLESLKNDSLYIGWTTYLTKRLQEHNQGLNPKLYNRMKVYSWNIFFRNTDFDRAFEFIANLDFDILCLQEVPESFLERLSKLDVHIASAPDVDRLFPNGTERNFLVILSRHRIVAKSAFAFTAL